MQDIQKELISHPIGYPVLLMPAARLFDNYLPGYKMYSFLFFVAFIFSFIYLLKDRLKKSELIIVLF
ncbi:MAG: hypothetical protein PF545_05405, partial [Elusimicrobia bacterium]|nr:hypothetical protein [Elusimicrobiota bacterium]